VVVSVSVLSVNSGNTATASPGAAPATQSTGPSPGSHPDEAEGGALSAGGGAGGPAAVSAGGAWRERSHAPTIKAAAAMMAIPEARSTVRRE
jgi:hypothetical protein